MALITNNISGSSSDGSKIGITGSIIISNSPDAQFPRLGTDTVFFVSGSETAKAVLGGAAKISGSLSTDGSVTLGDSVDDTLNVAGEAIFSKSVTATENVVAGIDLKSNFSSGDEGGQIFLNKPVTNTTINAGVSIDVYQDKVRFFENGGTARGYYIDISAGGAGASTNLVGGGGGAPTGAQYVTLATNASLTDERVLNAGTGITLTDGGAGSTITTAIDNSIVATVSGTQFKGTVGVTGSFGVSTLNILSGVLYQSNGVVKQSSPYPFVWDDVNIRLGIGTAAPAKSIHIGPNAGASIRVGPNSSYVDFVQANSTTYRWVPGGTVTRIEQNVDHVFANIKKVGWNSSNLADIDIGISRGGAGILTVSGSAPGAILRFNASSTPLAAGDFGMNTSTGRPNALIGGSVRELAHTDEVALLTGATFTGAISAPGITSTSSIVQSGGNVSLAAQTDGSVSIGNDSGTTATAILGGGVVIISGSTGTNYTVGGETGIGTITLGRSTASNTIDIGAGTTASGATQTVNIATSATGTGKALVSIGNAVGASGLTLSAGTSDMTLTGATTTDYSIGSSSGTGTITVGKSTAANTINIGNAGNSTFNNQAINIGAGAGRSTVTIGATTGASSLTLDSGTGTINIGSSAANRIINIGPPDTAGGSAISHTINVGDIPSNASSVTSVVIGTGGAGVTQNTISIGNYGSTNASVTTIYGDTVVLTNTTSSGDKVGIGTSAPAVKLDVVSNHSANYAARVWNDGNSSDRYGLYVQCGTDASTGTNYAIGIHDGDGTAIGYITFSGATVTYGAFTGDHYAKIIDPGTEKIYGTILKIVSASTPPAGSKKVEYVVEKTSTAKDPAVFGAYSGDFSGAPDETLRDYHSIFCLGDGHILVTDQGGNINIGDFICSSDMPGHGMKQDDDLLHNYTVAKATEAVDFSAVPIDPVRGYKSVLICCTYHGA